VRELHEFCKKPIASDYLLVALRKDRRVQIRVRMRLAAVHAA
jgi:hypothetical protein